AGLRRTLPIGWTCRVRASTPSRPESGIRVFNWRSGSRGSSIDRSKRSLHRRRVDMRRKRQWTTAIVLGFMAAVGVMAPSAAKGQDVGARGIIGTWQGVLVAGGARLRVVFRVTEAPDGGLEATMDSPDQGAMGIPIA